MAPLCGKFILGFIFFCFQVTRPEKVKIVEEPAVYRSGMNQFNMHQARSPSESVGKLVARVKPSPVSGPPHLRVLAGKCFSLIYDGYKYEFCPFHNVTQKEQAVRWNAFAGILGVWSEWIIVNNTFQAMLFANGDMCPGEKPRQTKVVLRCGDQNKVLSVVEPTMCQYEMRFETPLACPIDAFLVYPVLSEEGKKEWEQIEEALYREELTSQGYNKYRRRLFQKENFIPLDQSEKDKQEEERNISEMIAEALSSNTVNNTGPEIPAFHSKEECTTAYSELVAEVQRLRKQLNISSDSKGVQTNGSASLNDSLQLSKNDTEELTQSSKSNVTDEQKILHENTLRAMFKGEMGDTRMPKNQVPEDKKRNETFNSEVNNLRGDPGVLLNRIIKSTDHTERKTARTVLEKGGEF